MATLYTEKQLQNIILYCPDEDTSYSPPNIMVDIHGNKLYAYVTLIMLGDNYIPGAIVLSYSIKRLNSQADLVVLVSPDVSDDGKLLLSTFFDRVIVVDLIYVPNWRTKKQKHRLYLNYVFTKFHLFNLTQYKKVILIDADALILKHPDYLFSLNAPAGTLIEDKKQFITYDDKGNYILPPDDRIKWYQEMCECCGNGKIIPKSMTDKIILNPSNSGIGGGLILLEPQKNEFDDIIKDVSTNTDMAFLVKNKFIWPEQQYLTLRYSGKWTSVNPRFFGLQGYPHWSILYGIQYGGDKPWVLESKIDIGTRIQYPDFILWHKFYSDILKKYPYLKINNVLNEANDMHKFFYRHNLSRYTPNRSSEIIELIKNKLNISKVYPKQVDMYFLDTNLTYQPYELKPMFIDIGPYEYFKPLIKLSENFHNTDYFHKLYSSINLQTYNQPLNNILNSKLDIIDIDNIMLQYIKCRPSTFAITIWPIAYNYTEQIIDELNKNGNIYYVRNISLTFNGLQNLMFWMYDDLSFHERNEFISKKMNHIKASKQENNNISIILFDNINNINIKRNLFNKHGNDVMHINDHFYQTVNCCQLLLNQNTIDLLNQQSIMLNPMSSIEQATHLKLQTYKKLLFTNLSQLEIEKIITIDDTILYTYGLRPFTHINALMTVANNPVLEALIYDNFLNIKSKLQFAKIYIEGYYWKDSQTAKNKQIFDAFGIKSNADLVCNPRFHMYYQGIKFYLLDHEIVRKLYRHNEQDWADFIFMLFYKNDLINKFMTIDINTHKLIIKDNYIKLLALDLNFNVILSSINDKMIHEIYEQLNKKYNKLNNITIEIIKDLFY